MTQVSVNVTCVDADVARRELGDRRTHNDDLWRSRLTERTNVSYVGDPRDISIPELAPTLLHPSVNLANIVATVDGNEVTIANC